MADPRWPYCESWDSSSTRRTFLATLLAGITSVCAGPTISGSVKRAQALLATAGALSQRVAVDLHAHPGPFAGASAVPEAARDLPTVLADMQHGQIDAALFCFVADRPVLRRSGPAREPNPGELFLAAKLELDQVLPQLEGTIALTPADVMASKRQGRPCAILGFEGADALEGDLARLQLFYDRGIRVIQLVHNRVNELGDIQTDAPRHGGLTPFGREVVKTMNRLGMLIDVAHASADTVRGVLAETRHPIIDSHTRPRAHLDIRRARSDEELRSVVKTGGVIGVWPLAWEKRKTFEDFLIDIDYMKTVVGIDHLGIGTDLNGVGGNTVVPTHKEFALIPAGLLARGYPEAEVAKIIGGNFMRVFREVTETKG